MCARSPTRTRGCRKRRGNSETQSMSSSRRRCRSRRTRGLARSQMDRPKTPQGPTPKVRPEAIRDVAPRGAWNYSTLLLLFVLFDGLVDLGAHLSQDVIDRRLLEQRLLDTAFDRRLDFDPAWMRGGHLGVSELSDEDTAY